VSERGGYWNARELQGKGEIKTKKKGRDMSQNRQEMSQVRELGLPGREEENEGLFWSRFSVTEIIRTISR
jgi:hypothetical protein